MQVNLVLKSTFTPNKDLPEHLCLRSTWINFQINLALRQSFSVRSFEYKFEEPGPKSVVLFEGNLVNSGLEILLGSMSIL